ncbi:hypothetical protein PXNS11_270030 [Stutzerimonas xanthomarina]|nr:hypothetical protein PXNS11_270030 [Stutzerimonas xanthomarina]
MESQPARAITGIKPSKISGLSEISAGKDECLTPADWIFSDIRTSRRPNPAMAGESGTRKPAW